MLIAAPAHPAAAAAADPSALVTAMGEQIRQVLADHSLSPVQSQQRFHSVVDEGFDIPAISRFVLGRFWQGSTASFRQEFDDVFEDYVLQSLTARFADPSGESMTVTATRPEGQSSTIVSTTIVHADGAPSENVDWHVHHAADGFKIVDVSISGVSMALAYREQFAAVIDHDGGQLSALLPALLHKLDRPVANVTAGNTRANDGRQ